jgi:hypothetical protein
MAASDFVVKGKFLRFRWTAVDKKTVRQGHAAAKQLIRDSVGGKNIDLQNMSFEPDGIVFPFKTAMVFRSAYACISRLFKPMLVEAGVQKSQWGFKVIGDPVVTDLEVLKHEGTEPDAKVEGTDPKVEGTDPEAKQHEGTDPKVESTDSIIWPPSVPLKLTRSTQCDKGCGMRASGDRTLIELFFDRGFSV